jgi:tetratricopeptide (TPR) repeat protein
MSDNDLALLEEGIRRQLSGDPAGAAACYGRVPRDSRFHADALNLLGALEVQSGRPERGIALMEQATRSNPRNVTAWMNLGTVLRDIGTPGRPLLCLRRAFLLDPTRKDVSAALETVADHTDGGQTGGGQTGGSQTGGAETDRVQAEWVQRAGLILEPTSHHMLTARANALAERGDQRSALALLKRCLIANPSDGTAAFNLANAHRSLERHDGAEAGYARALILRPRSGEAWNNWGLTAFHTQGTPEARRRFAQAVAVSPTLSQGWFNLARANAMLAASPTAIRSMRRGLLLEPASLSGLCDLSGMISGMVPGMISGMKKAGIWASRARLVDPLSHRPYLKLALVDAASETRSHVLPRLKQAVLVEPDAADGWYNLSIEIGRNKRPEQAVRYSTFATLIDDKRPATHLNKALYLLLLEQFEAGWDAHRRRMETPEAAAFKRTFSIPEWSGPDPHAQQPIAGRHLLLWGEQGIGDEVQFLTLAPYLLAQGARLTILTEARLRPLLRRSFPTRVSVPDVSPPTGHLEDHHGADFHLALGDLPHRLKLFCGGDAVPAPWIVPDPALTTRLRQGLQARNPEKFLVGITWRSKALITGERRTIAPSLWRPLAAVPGIACVSLQYGARPDDKAVFADQAGLTLDTEHGVEPLDSLDELAALISAVDLVICPANNTVHFAGAMAKPCWTLLPNFPDWRWGLRRSDTQWYHGMRTLRQTRDGEWSDVMDTVRDTLLRLHI